MTLTTLDIPRRHPGGALPCRRTIAVSDSHVLFAQGFASLFADDPHVDVVVLDGGPGEVARTASTRDIDLVLLDGDELDREDTSVLTSLHVRGCRVVVVVRSAGTGSTRRLLDAGASGVILRDADLDEFRRAVRRALEGGRYLDPTLGAQIADAQHQAEQLTQRELQVAELTALGHSSTAISSQLFVSPRTVETHRSRIMSKLGIGSRVELVRWALDNRVIGPVL